MDLGNFDTEDVPTADPSHGMYLWPFTFSCPQILKQKTLKFYMCYTHL